MPERLESEVLHKVCYINTVTFTFFIHILSKFHRLTLEFKYFLGKSPGPK